MVDILIRNVPPAIDLKLRERAAANKRSLSDEAKAMLAGVLHEEPAKAAQAQNAWEALRADLKPENLFDLEIPPRRGSRPPPDFV